MRLLCLSTWFPYPPDNGAKIRAYYLIRALSEAHDVTLVAFRPVRMGNGHLTEVGSNHLQVYDVPVDPFQYVGVSQLVKFASPIPVTYWPIAAMRRAVDQVSASSTWEAMVAIQGNVAPYALRFKCVPKIVDVDTALSFQMRERREHHVRLLGHVRTWLSWQKAHWYEKQLFRRFDACTIVSAAEVAYIQSLVRGTHCRVDVISNGVDCDRNRSGLFAVRPNSLIYNGALTYRANYDAVQYFLAQIYPLIRSKITEVSFTITGSTDGVDRSGLQLDDSVHLTGYVDDVRAVVGSSAVCVIPLRQGGGTRLKILEAMALGTPIVSTTKGAEGLDVEHNEHLLLADDPEIFAAYTVKLLQDTALRQRLIDNARRLVEQHYDWTSIGRQFVQVVEERVARQQSESN